MKLPQIILHRLLLGEHILPHERDLLGITSKTNIKIEDLVLVLAGELTRTDRFPPASKEESLSPFYDGVVINKEPKGKYVCTVKRPLADNPTIISEKTEFYFDNAKDAAEYFIKWDLFLPGKLDGILVQ